MSTKRETIDIPALGESVKQALNELAKARAMHEAAEQSVADARRGAADTLNRLTAAQRKVDDLADAIRGAAGRDRPRG